MSNFCQETTLSTVITTEPQGGSLHNFPLRLDVSSELNTLQTSLEDRINIWLARKGITIDDPKSKQRDFYDQSKQGVLTIQEQLTNCSSGEERDSACASEDRNHNKEENVQKKASYRRSSFSNFLQRRGLKPAPLDCKTPNFAATSSLH